MKMTRNHFSKKCIKSASLQAPMGYNWLLLRVKAKLKVMWSKALERLKMVPRAGLEPARPMLWYPRILSPDIIFCKHLLSLDNAILKAKKVHQKCITGITNRLQITPIFGDRLFAKSFTFSPTKTRRGAGNHGMQTNH